jgi:hypothetical protein
MILFWKGICCSHLWWSLGWLVAEWEGVGGGGGRLGVWMGLVLAVGRELVVSATCLTV